VDKNNKQGVVFAVVRMVNDQKVLIRVFRTNQLAKEFIKIIELEEPHSTFKVDVKAVWSAMPPKRTK
jgi:hypothetical protein